MSNSEAVCLKDIEEAAHKILPKKALDYYKSGAEQQSTLRDNCRAFQRCQTSMIAYFSIYFFVRRLSISDCF